MRFTSKTGLKLDKSELKRLQSAKEILLGIEHHTLDDDVASDASTSRVALTKIVAHFSQSSESIAKHDARVVKELPLNPDPKTEAVEEELHPKSRA